MKTLLTAILAATAILIAVPTFAAISEYEQKVEMEEAKKVATPDWVREHELPKNLERIGDLDSLLIAWYSCSEFPDILLVVAYNILAIEAPEKTEASVASYAMSIEVMVFGDDSGEFNYLAKREPVFYGLAYTNVPPERSWEYFLSSIVPKTLEILGGVRIAPVNPE